MKPLTFTFHRISMLCALFAMGTWTAAQQSLTGIYTMQSGDVTLNLQLSQQGNTLQGTLSGSTGASFQLSGEAENAVGYGTCTGTEGSVFFEVYVEGQDLTLSLIEPDQWGGPDYNKAQYLQFRKTGLATGSQGTATGTVTGALGLGAAGSQSQAEGPSGTGGVYQPDRASGTGTGTATTGTGTMGTGTMGTATTGTATVAGSEIGDPAWGIKFKLPQGWLKQQSTESAVVGHNTIAGMILVFPHMARNMQEMQAEMMKGIQEEGSYLAIGGGLQTLAQNVLAGDYSGVADGTQVKARGFGILSPNGGGAYLVAVSTPDQLGQELVGAAQSMVQSAQYFKVEAGDLVQHFAGNWAHHTANTSTWICFCPDGTYSEQYEASYSGDFTDGAGNNTGNWNATGQDSDRGRWTVRGNKDAGTIAVKLANGEEIYYEYKVHVEEGQKYYREYWFNGNFYSKSE